MNVQTEAEASICPDCGADLLPATDNRCGILTVEDYSREHNREFFVRHCNRCGALLIGIVPMPVPAK